MHGQGQLVRVRVGVRRRGQTTGVRRIQHRLPRDQSSCTETLRANGKNKRGGLYTETMWNVTGQGDRQIDESGTLRIFFHLYTPSRTP